MLTALWALIPTSVKWIGLSVLVGLIGFGAWKWEHAAKLKAQAAKATAIQGLQIGYEGYVKLYQEREAIKAKADQQRRKLDELQKANDLDGLADTFNNPGGGVRRNVPANPPGSVKAPAAYYDPESPGAQYKEAP